MSGEIKRQKLAATGSPGKPGKPGKQGIPGKQGLPGTRGLQGRPGELGAGARGAVILSMILSWSVWLFIGYHALQ